MEHDIIHSNAARALFNIYCLVPTSYPTAVVLPIEGNSSSDFSFNYFLMPLKASKIMVLVAGSYELQDVLNSTLNYTSTLQFKPIEIALSHGTENISATVQTALAQTYAGPMAVYVFDVPAEWHSFFDVSITNPENYPVCWIVNILLYDQVISTNWLTILFVSIVPIIIGIINVAHPTKSNQLATS